MQWSATPTPNIFNVFDGIERPRSEQYKIGFFVFSFVPGGVHIETMFLIPPRVWDIRSTGWESPQVATYAYWDLLKKMSNSEISYVCRELDRMQAETAQ